jgi:hypothetical protein
MTIRLGLAAAILALHLAAAVPTPQSHFGHPIGVDRVLLDWDKVVSYFHALEKSSDRVRVREFGKTVDGRPMLAAWISAPETLRDLKRYQSIQQKLADPRTTSPAEAEKLIAGGKTVVMITCSIHATEVASTHTAVEFAYRLITEENPKFQAILRNTIVILVPSLNPDGVDIVTNWYRKTLGTPYEGTSPPDLYHRYLGHDNNRDWYIFSQPETRAVVTELHNAWHPQIVYDVHQQGAYASRIFVPPWLDPIEPNVDPILMQEGNAIGAGMAADLTSAGKTGVAINALYDFWTPARHYQAYHGGMRILSESASARLASPITVKPDDISDNALGYDPRQRSWNYLEPWTSGEWHLRDIIDYQSIAWESCLYQAAVRREDLLRAFYRVGQRAIERSAPYAFVISKSQFDPGASKVLLETLRFGMVEVETAQSPFEADGVKYPAGSFVIRMQQPYGSFAKTLLERQDYPDLRLYPGGPPRRPYDVTAQTLPLLMGVTVATVKDRFAARLTPSTQLAFEWNGGGGAELPASDVDSYKTINTIWKQGGKVFRDTKTGHFSRSPATGATPLKQPRIALFNSFQPSMDEGWTRWMLDRFGFDYQRVNPTEMRTPELRKKFDVIIFPDQSASSIANGYRPGAMPPEYIGGLGESGAEALRTFVRDGGTAIFLNHSTEYALDKLKIATKNVVRGVSSRDFYSPGSLLNVKLDVHNKLAFGLPKDITIWSEGSPAWDAEAAVARYPESGLLASGWLLGEKLLANRAALVDAHLGSGHAILFGMRPQYRAQSYQTVKLFFNAILLD